MVKAKLWLVVDGCWWWEQNYGWPWVDGDGGDKIIVGRSWVWVVGTKLRLVVNGCGWSWILAQFSNAHIKQKVLFI